MAGSNEKEIPLKVIATNRKARHEYFIEDTFEAGIMLTGTEIKSARNGRVNLSDGFVLIREGEAWLHNVHIAHFEQANRFNHPEMRARKLLLHKQEIRLMHSRATQRNWTIVPLSMYINQKGKAKVEIALVRGKLQHDKRDTIAKRDNERDLRRALKGEF